MDIEKDKTKFKYSRVVIALFDDKNKCVYRARRSCFNEEKAMYKTMYDRAEKALDMLTEGRIFEMSKRVIKPPRRKNENRNSSQS